MTEPNVEFESVKTPSVLNWHRQVAAKLIDPLVSYDTELVYNLNIASNVKSDDRDAFKRSVNFFVEWLSKIVTSNVDASPDAAVRYSFAASDWMSSVGRATSHWLDLATHISLDSKPYAGRFPTPNLLNAIVAAKFIMSIMDDLRNSIYNNHVSPSFAKSMNMLNHAETRLSAKIPD